MKKIRMEWTAKAKTEAEAARIKELVVNSEELLTKLRGILQARIESIRTERLSKANYTTNYPYLMADLNATERCLVDIQKLLTTEE